MKILVFTAALAVAATTVPAHAQFGWSVTFDPTQAAHALSVPGGIVHKAGWLHRERFRVQPARFHPEPSHKR